MDELKSLREQINLIDGWMANLFEQRMALCERVGEIKAREGLPILDQAREQSILQKIAYPRRLRPIIGNGCARRWRFPNRCRRKTARNRRFPPEYG